MSKIAEKEALLSFNAFRLNLAGFVNSLPERKIKFVFFYANNLKQPYMRESFKEWNTNGKIYYICYGENDNYIYVYNEDELKLIVKNRSPLQNQSSFISTPAPIDIYNVEIESVYKNAHTSQDEVTLGSHLDLCVKLGKQYNYINTHYTKYSYQPEALVGSQFDRDGDTKCDFTLTPENISLLKDGAINDVKCERRTRTSCMKDTYEDIYPSYEKVIGGICKEIVTPRLKGGKPQTLKYQGKTYKVQHGPRGGRFIQLSPAHRKYVGGSPNGFGITYNGLNLFSPEFIGDATQTGYLNQFLQIVKDARKDIMSVSIFHDFSDTSDSKEYMYVLYDFAENCASLFQVNLLYMLMACHASKRSEKNEQEKVALAYAETLKTTFTNKNSLGLLNQAIPVR